MFAALAERAVTHISTPSEQRGLTPTHRVRPLIEPGNWAASDPFLLLMEDTYGRNTFSPHPHRGIETFSFILDGELEHFDNHGNGGRVSSGDALLMTAGRGIVHDERPVDDRLAHIYQLWVNLPKSDKLTDARVQELHASNAPERKEPGVTARIFSGSSAETTAETKNFAPFLFVDVSMAPGARFEQDFPGDYNGFLIMVTGTATVGRKDTLLNEGQLAWLEHIAEPSKVSLTAGAAGCRVMAVAGQPLREPVASRGPFVMNDSKELDQAFAEFRRDGEAFGRA
jgi:quercetin 2,3-dioxygenase